MPKFQSYAHTQGQTIFITLPVNSRENKRVLNKRANNSHSASKRIPIILNILKKYKKFLFLGAIVDGQVMTKLDLELYTTLDHSVYNQFFYVINYNKFIIDDHRLIRELLFPIHHSLAILIAMLSGPVLVRAAKHRIGSHSLAVGSRELTNATSGR